ncbi:MAG: metallophosphoesterase, partial [Candidatus Heimdallarchaeota archaeon]|nr:metallophosphoesterase [Candidatus Heimdallarchaeota archaeon]
TNYGFGIECRVRHIPEMYETVMDFCAELPLVGIVDEKGFIAHGGIPSDVDNVMSLAKIRTLEKTKEPERTSAYAEVFWNDPIESDLKENFGLSYRGMGKNYTRKAVETFFESSGLEFIVRAHSRINEGWKSYFNNKVWSLFSSQLYDFMITPHVLKWKNNKFTPFKLWDGKCDLSILDIFTNN